MWSKEEGEEVVEKEQDLPFWKDRAVGCTLNHLSSPNSGSVPLLGCSVQRVGFLQFSRQ